MGGSKKTEDALGATSDHEDINSLSKALVGGLGALGDYYFPPDLVGGCCPRVAGEEQDIVWNAAAEAADTERIHIVWQAKGDKIWYLAIQSADQSSHPDTWCPFASLLPSMKDAALPPIVYTYFSEETATMMTLLSDGLQIHRGTASVVRAKAERIARELDEAPIIDLVPDRIAKLTPFPWYSLSLFEERARRVLATVVVFSSIIFACFAILIWLGAAMSTVTANADLEEIRVRSERKSLELLRSVQLQRASPMRKKLAAFSDLNDGLLTLNGYLEIYTIIDGKAVWRAVIPKNITANRIKEIGGQMLETDDRGVIIGNSRESLTIEKSKSRRRRR
ncbi:MAG TPA: hypothetical protein DD400_05375 [Rhodospirillaceae bacterium]|nr:hypothetical protein [Rhodospirillaceae bacterium]